MALGAVCVVHRWTKGESIMRRPAMVLTCFVLSGCKLFGAIEEARDLLEEPVTMQGLLVGIELPASLGVNPEGTILDLGARAQAWVQRTGTSGVQVVDGASVSLISDRRGSVKLVQSGSTWTADGQDGLEYIVGDEVKLIADYGGERGSISMDLPAGPVVTIPETHTPGIGINVTISPPAGEADFDNGGVIVYDLLNQEVVWESDYNVDEPIDPDNLQITVDGSAFSPDGLFAVGVVGLVASTEDDLVGLNPLGSGFLVGQMVVKPLSTF